jgi:hypothetical protein
MVLRKVITGLVGLVLRPILNLLAALLCLARFQKAHRW